MRNTPAFPFAASAEANVGGVASLGCGGYDASTAPSARISAIVKARLSLPSNSR
jgi:hypothetical protein